MNEKKLRDLEQLAADYKKAQLELTSDYCEAVKTIIHSVPLEVLKEQQINQEYDG